MFSVRAGSIMGGSHIVVEKRGISWEIKVDSEIRRHFSKSRKEE